MIGLQPRSKVILRHAQQDFDTISSAVFFSSIFVPGKTSVIRVGDLKYLAFNKLNRKDVSTSRNKESWRKAKPPPSQYL